MKFLVFLLNNTKENKDDKYYFIQFDKLLSMGQLKYRKK